MTVPSFIVVRPLEHVCGLVCIDGAVGGSGCAPERDVKVLAYRTRQCVMLVLAAAGRFCLAAGIGERGKNESRDVKLVRGGMILRRTLLLILRLS